MKTLYELPKDLLVKLVSTIRQDVEKEHDKYFLSMKYFCRGEFESKNDIKIFYSNIVGKTLVTEIRAIYTYLIFHSLISVKRKYLSKNMLRNIL